MSEFYVEYSAGPRYIDGINIDADTNSTVKVREQERQISEPVTGLNGLGYQPGQKNADGTEL